MSGAAIWANYPLNSSVRETKRRLHHGTKRGPARPTASPRETFRRGAVRRALLVWAGGPGWGCSRRLHERDQDLAQLRHDIWGGQRGRAASAAVDPATPEAGPGQTLPRSPIRHATPRHAQSGTRIPGASGLLTRDLRGARQPIGRAPSAGSGPALWLAHIAPKPRSRLRRSEPRAEGRYSGSVLLQRSLHRRSGRRPSGPT